MTNHNNTRLGGKNGDGGLDKQSPKQTSVATKSLTSDYVKDLLIKRFHFFNGYVGAVYECAGLSSADVLAVKHGGRVQEFEIKLSKADLIGELRCARVAKSLDNATQYYKKEFQATLPLSEKAEVHAELANKYGHATSLSRTKLEKHRRYLTDQDRTGYLGQNLFVPHTFYWCVPYSLLELCRELNKGLPYGIYCFDMPQTSKYYQKFIVKPARSLGGQGDKTFFELFNRACTHWEAARARIQQLEEKVNDLQPSDAPSQEQDTLRRNKGTVGDGELYE